MGVFQLSNPHMKRRMCIRKVLKVIKAVAGHMWLLPTVVVVGCMCQNCGKAAMSDTIWQLWNNLLTQLAPRIPQLSNIGQQVNGNQHWVPNLAWLFIKLHRNLFPTQYSSQPNDQISSQMQFWPSGWPACNSIAVTYKIGFSGLSMRLIVYQG